MPNTRLKKWLLFSLEHKMGVILALGLTTYTGYYVYSQNQKCKTDLITAQDKYKQILRQLEFDAKNYEKINELEKEQKRKDEEQKRINDEQKRKDEEQKKQINELKKKGASSKSDISVKHTFKKEIEDINKLLASVNNKRRISEHFWYLGHLKDKAIFENRKIAIKLNGDHQKVLHS